jgi:hypothetical protein
MRRAMIFRRGMFVEMVREYRIVLWDRDCDVVLSLVGPIDIFEAVVVGM